LLTNFQITHCILEESYKGIKNDIETRKAGEREGEKGGRKERKRESKKERERKKKKSAHEIGT
jgi:hypothetical protein